MITAPFERLGLALLHCSSRRCGHITLEIHKIVPEHQNCRLLEFSCFPSGFGFSSGYIGLDACRNQLWARAFHVQTGEIPLGVLPNLTERIGSTSSPKSMFRSHVEPLRSIVVEICTIQNFPSVPAKTSEYLTFSPYARFYR